MSIVLPAETNYPLEASHADWEDALITAKNKWLIGHPEGGLDEGCHIGLVGKNLNVKFARGPKDKDIYSVGRSTETSRGQ